MLPTGSGGTGRLSTEVKRTEGSDEGDKCPCRRDTIKIPAIVRRGELLQAEGLNRQDSTA